MYGRVCMLQILNVTIGWLLCRSNNTEEKLSWTGDMVILSDYGHHYIGVEGQH